MFHKGTFDDFGNVKVIAFIFAIAAFTVLCDLFGMQIFVPALPKKMKNPGSLQVTMTNSSGRMPATLNSMCDRTSYTASAIEMKFKEHTLQLTNDQDVLCETLKGVTDQWLQMNLQETPLAMPLASSDIFSQICPNSAATKQVIEPLAGLLRDPRMFCLENSVRILLSVDWLVLADGSSFPSATSTDSRRIFFDAGGSRFADALKFFLTKYEERGIEMDQIYVWEAKKREISKYWDGTPQDVRDKWEPRLTWYNGVPVTTEKGNMHNPVHRIHELCRIEDFCAFKLDIDTPHVEYSLVKQLLENHGHLKEFFFEHHVHNPLMSEYWGRGVDMSLKDSYLLFTTLREKGLRAHPWV